MDNTIDTSITNRAKWCITIHHNNFNEECEFIEDVGDRDLLNEVEDLAEQHYPKYVSLTSHARVRLGIKGDEYNWFPDLGKFFKPLHVSKHWLEECEAWRNASTFPVNPE